MCIQVREDLLVTARETIDRFSLLEPGEHIVVAFSGGKDSIILTLALKALKFDVTAVAIDMGYDSEWSERITELSRNLGIDTDIVSVRGPAAASSGATLMGIRKRIEILDQIAELRIPATPCTHCYNVKILALASAVDRLGAAKVAFAHHMTDASASLIKEALMRIDCWDQNHSTFTRANFAALVTRLTIEASNFRYDMKDAFPLTRRISELVHEALVDTDEPPRQPLRSDCTGIEIIRPLFGADEAMIIRAVEDLRVHPEGSGCGHGATVNTYTPREMVHYRILREAAKRDFQVCIRDLVEMGVDRRGSTSTRSRQRRQEALGVAYKPVGNGYDKL
jgi:7-cyano-7-deazaguanine synthase in queuosine biosynthesis